MLEWTLQHPWMTFFIILAIIKGLVYIVKYITGYKDFDKDGDCKE